VIWFTRRIAPDGVEMVPTAMIKHMEFDHAHDI
jgi:hypothetical protein